MTNTPFWRANASSCVIPATKGCSYSNLNDVVKRAHIGTIKLEGNASVSRGNAMASVLCSLLRFPPSAASIKLTVIGQHFSDQMIWGRAFEAEVAGLYQFSVCVSLPLLGKLIAYEGVLALDSHGNQD